MQIFVKFHTKFLNKLIDIFNFSAKLVGIFFILQLYKYLTYKDWGSWGKGGRLKLIG